MRRARTIKMPPQLEDAYKLLCQPGGPFDGYPSFNAWITGLALYALAFPRRHDLTIAIARMHADDQAKIHDLILAARTAGRDISAELPKPATAAALLALASKL